MPLDVRRLLTSETWIEASDDPKLGHALVSLWCESWQQVPAGSLPNNERVLARFAMCDAPEWERIRERALENWQLCSDGRLYHPVVAEKAREAWADKLAYRQRKAEFSERQRERANTRWQKPEASRTDAGGNAAAMPRHEPGTARGNAETMPMKGKGTGTGTGRGRGRGRGREQSGGALAPSGPPLPEERFWSRLDALGRKGIGRSRCTQLVKLNGGDFIEANRVLDAAEAAKNPTAYLGGVIRRLEQAPQAAPPGANSNVPTWVNQKRVGGIVVDAAGPNRWRCLGETLNDAGEVVGF
jgi:hypothetical protein